MPSRPTPPDANPAPRRPTLASRILHQRGCVGWLVVLAILVALVTVLLGA